MSAISQVPAAFPEIDRQTRESGFTMPSEILTCSLLRTLAASKPAGRFLELGTGTGLSTAWLLDGMDAASTLVSVDNAPEFLDIAIRNLGTDSRADFVCRDGGEWLEENQHSRFDFIFADTWHGKYLLLDEALALLNPGGMYFIDDMLPQANWPEGHDLKVANLRAVLAARPDLDVTEMDWASGLIIAVKK